MITLTIVLLSNPLHALQAFTAAGIHSCSVARAAWAHQCLATAVQQRKSHVCICVGTEPKIVTMTTLSLSNPLHALQAFTAAVQSVLRGHTCALQQLPEAVQQRRMAEQSHSSMAVGRRTESQQSLPAVTVLEVVLHTEKLQVMLQLFVSSNSCIVTEQCSGSAECSSLCSGPLHQQVMYTFDAASCTNAG